MLIEGDDFDYRASPYIPELQPRELRGSLDRLTLLNYMGDCVVAKGNALGIVKRYELN